MHKYYGFNILVYVFSICFDILVYAFSIINVSNGIHFTEHNDFAAFGTDSLVYAFSMTVFFHTLFLVFFSSM